MPGAEAGASSRIFISYRREDSSGHVLALMPSLRSHFGADRIFKDTDNIPPGADFLKFIRNELDSCSVLLAIIGREWLAIQDQRLKRRRIDNPEDFLRVEVSSALKNERIRVIPVLIERARMPSAQDLPPDLADLAFRNAIELSDLRWESDVRLLIEAIEHAVVESAAKPEAPEAPIRPGLMDLQKRRAREIASQLEHARQAFESEDFEGTLWACDKALLLDPQTPEALDLVDRARKALDEKKISAWLEDARKALARGEIGTASDLIDQALAVDRDSKQALTIRDEMLDLRRERERERDRARTVQAATDRARASVEEGDFESAVRHADDALATDSGDLNAQNLKAKALAALDERRKQRELKRRAQQTISDARSRFESGAHQDALASLREFSPGHELVSQALQELQDQLEAIQRKITAENERLEELRRAEEAQRAAAEQSEAEKKAREEAEKKAREDKERRDRERQEEEARLLVEAQAAEEQRRHQEKEAQRLAEAQRKLAEEQRKEEERKREEERRKNEERRKKEAEEKKQRAAEQERNRKEDEARRLASEAQRQMEAEVAERRKEAEEARWRKEAEDERQRKAEEARRQKEAQEARRRKEEEDAQRRPADEPREAERRAAEARERKRLAEETRAALEGTRLADPERNLSEAVIDASRLKYIALAAALLGAVLVVAVLLRPGTDTTPPPTVTTPPATDAGTAPPAAAVPAARSPITINAIPWASVRIVPKETSQPPSNGVTPFVADLPEGEYTLEFRNDLFTPFSQPLTVRASQPANVTITMPGADVDRIVNDVLGPVR